MASSKCTDDRVRFSFPRLSGADQFRELVHQFGGPELVCKHLHIAPNLLATYLAGELDPPYTLMLAVYWHGPFGFSQGFSEAHWTHQYNYQQRIAAEDKVARYRAFLGTVAREGLLDADRCMHLAHEAGIDDAWPAQPVPEWLALADETAAAAERERRRIQRVGDGSRKRRKTARASWQTMQAQEQAEAAANPGPRAIVKRGPARKRLPLGEVGSQTCAA